MNIFSIDQKVDISWHPETLTVLEQWKGCDVDLESFRKAVFVKGINHARGSGAKAWIHDISQAPDNFNDEILEMIQQDRYPALAWAGVKYFISIDPNSSEIQVNPDTSATRGVQRVVSPSLEAAFAWLKRQV